MTLAEQEDDEMQRALEISRGRTSPLQETGTTTANKPYFGPVRNEYHDTKNWIMTTSKSTAKEILLNPEPKDRKRPIKTPAFLRPSPAGHRLPGLVSILHTIPAAREALLSRNYVQNDYGYHNEWWDGVGIESSRIIHGEVDYDVVDREVVYESQRLMAFLDGTERAYGSSEALAALPGIREYQGDAVVKSFLDTWSDAVLQYDPAATFAKLFQSTGVRIIHGFPHPENVMILDLEVNEQLLESGQTLYDAIDALMWPGWDGDDLEGEVFLENVADVFIIRITRGNDTVNPLDVKIPSVWYADRYRQSSRPRVQQMLAAKAAVRSEIDDLNARKQKASEFRRSGQQGSPVDVNRLLEVARKHFEKTAKYGDETKSVKVPEMEQHSPGSEVHSRIAEELKILSDRVAGKLQGTQKTFQRKTRKAK